MRSHDSFDPDRLHVVAVVHNPLRFRSRHRLFSEFVDRCLAAGVSLHVVEASFGERVADHTERGVDWHTVVIQQQELWVKESLINIGLSRLPPEAKYVAWIDGDVQLVRPDWAQETVHQLQHYRIVQMFQTAADLGPTGEILQVFNGFGYSQAAALPEVFIGSQEEVDAANYYRNWQAERDAYSGQESPRTPAKFWHPGYAWAARRDVLDHMGGLLDWSVLGSADHMMALAWLGKVGRAVPSGLHANYSQHAMIYQERCEEAVRGDVGFVPGTLLHFWHGKKRDRRYVDRWNILRKWQYDPERDIRRDVQGLVQLTRVGERMRDDLRAYFRARNEDSIDLE